MGNYKDQMVIMEQSEQLNDDFFNFTPPFVEEKTSTPEDIIRSKHKDAYFNLIRTFQSICMDLKAGKRADGNKLKNGVDEIIAYLKEDERMLLGLANAPYSYISRNLDKSVYGIIVIHGINVMIYSLKISIDLAIPDMRLPYIGAAALYHRLGLLNMAEDKLCAPPVGKALLKEIKKHDQKPEVFINNIKIDDFHMESIQYLIALIKEDQQILQKTSLREAMYQYSMVIHLCYEFERLTHLPGHGEALSPIDAMKKMRDDMGDCCHPEIVKIFFNKLSIYPVGTFVKLSSSEVAKIVSINEHSLLRPVIMIVLDDEGREKLRPVRINLREKPNLYIKKSVMDEFLTEKYIDLF